MTDAPERIWLGCQRGDVEGVTLEADGWSATSEPEPNAEWIEGPYEYIRADLSSSPEVVKELVEALELADAALSGADIDMKHVWRKIKSALANAKLEGGE